MQVCLVVARGLPDEILVAEGEDEKQVEYGIRERLFWRLTLQLGGGFS